MFIFLFLKILTRWMNECGGCWRWQDRIDADPSIEGVSGFKAWPGMGTSLSQINLIPSPAYQAATANDRDCCGWTWIPIPIPLKNNPCALGPLLACMPEQKLSLERGMKYINTRNRNETAHITHNNKKKRKWNEKLEAKCNKICLK